MDRKTFKGHVKADEAGKLRVVFSSLNVIDHDGDVTRPGAFQPGQKVRIAQWGHDWGTWPLGKGAISSDNNEAWMDGELFLNTPQGTQAYETIKALGELLEWSYGFRVTKESFGEFEGRQVRFLEGLDVIEVSPVMQGAGIGTHTDMIKGLSGEGLSYTDHLEVAHDGLIELIERTKRRIAGREKEGRVLSSANHTRLQGLASALRGGLDDLDTLLAAVAPKEDDDDPKALDRILADFAFTETRLAELGAL